MHFCLVALGHQSVMADTVQAPKFGTVSRAGDLPCLLLHPAARHVSHWIKKAVPCAIPVGREDLTPERPVTVSEPRVSHLAW
jgi:hypothetical protein